MSKLDRKFQSPLARARGLGSAHEGVHHWLAERVSAFILIPLVLWIVWSVVQLRGAPYTVYTAWLETPLNAILMILFLATCAYHAAAGLQVIIEDYISCKATKLMGIIGVKIVFYTLALASIFSIVKVSL